MRIVVIGSGNLGQKHLDVWSQIIGVEVVGVIARNRSKLKKVTEQYETDAYGSIAEAIASTDIDIFDICTPTDTHVQLIKEAARLKKHVICEKPLALNATDARDAVAVCKQNGVHLLVGHTLRFFPEYRHARQHVLHNNLGKTGVFRMVRGVPHPPIATAWYADEERSGGLFVDLGIHDFDWLLWTLGDVQRVMAKQVTYTRDHGERLAYGFATLKMMNGTIAYVELSWTESEFNAAFELAGSKGMLVYDHKKNQPLQLNMHTSNISSSTHVELPNFIQNPDPFHLQLEHFLNCILEKEQPIVTVNEAIRAVEVAEAVVRSATIGQPITLKERGL